MSQAQEAELCDRKWEEAIILKVCFPVVLLHPARLHLLKLLLPLKRVIPPENCVQTQEPAGYFVFKLYQISSPMLANIHITGIVL